MSFFNRTLIQRERQFEPFEAGEPGSIDELLGHSESIRLLASPRAGAFPVAKRVFDVVLSSAALVILAPALLIAGAVVKIDSPGPIFFVQERIGLNRRRGERRSRVAGVEGESRLGFDRRKNMHPGRPFKIYKFRTMVQDAERFGPALASEHDPRVTRVGRFMSKIVL